MKNLKKSVALFLLVCTTAIGFSAIAYAAGSIWQCRNCGRQIHAGGYKPPKPGACEAMPNYPWGQHVWERIK